MCDCQKLKHKKFNFLLLIYIPKCIELNSESEWVSLGFFAVVGFNFYPNLNINEKKGLISWVEGSTPLFALYKKWQQREAIHQATKQPQPQPQTAAILRPSDLFHSKLTPLLQESGLSSLIGARAFAERRHACPAALLRQVLDALLAETPGDLLAKELWCVNLYIER
jgi:hypothetical protein